jgi:hypothetical protein
MFLISGMLQHKDFAVYIRELATVKIKKICPSFKKGADFLFAFI